MKIKNILSKNKEVGIVCDICGPISKYGDNVINKKLEINMSLHKRMETFSFNYHGVGFNNENYRREVNEHKK